MKIDSDKLRLLIQAHLDQRLSDEEFETLQDTLEGDPEARAEYVALAQLDAGLRDTGLAEPNGAAFSPEAKKGVKWWAVAAAAAVVIACLLPLTALLLTTRDSETSGGPAGGPVVAATRGVAVITAEAEAVWHEESLAVGVALKPGRLILKEGLAQIDFFGGASISLSGPAELELVNGDSAVLHRGRLKADVPPAARGFEVRTGDVLLEDLGTSFGLAVGEHGKADLIVFDGEVRATGTDGKPTLFFGSDSARFDAGVVIPQSAEKVGDFPDITDVIAGAGNRAQSRLAAWSEASLDLRRDPRLVAYYDFENLTMETRRLRNRAVGDAPSELDGGIVGAKVADGRWPGKGALDFRSEGDRVRFRIPGEFDALTLFAWVRIDALDRHLNSLFLTDHFDENEIHWQISRKGTMHFATSPMGVVDIPKHNRRFFSDPFWDPRDSGKWFFIATSVDRNAGEVVHYVNGEALGISGGTQMHKPLPRMRIGEADLGNWSDPIWPEAGIRTLNGRIDEFGLFAEALTAGEIRSLYQKGKP